MLASNQTDLIAITESTRNEDHPLIECHPDYQWIGKNRVDKLGGGIGMMFNTKTMSIIEEGLMNSLNDSLERLWIGVKYGSTPMVICVVYLNPVYH